MKGEYSENVSVLDLWRTSKCLIGGDHLLNVPGAKSNLWGACHWTGRSNLVEPFLPIIPLDSRIHYLQKMNT